MSLCIGAAPLRRRDDLIGRLQLPLLEQGLAVAKMSIEAALGDPEVPCENLDTNSVEACTRQPR